jgi:hypothetical protein
MDRPFAIFLLSTPRQAAAEAGAGPANTVRHNEECLPCSDTVGEGGDGGGGSGA